MPKIVDLLDFVSFYTGWLVVWILIVMLLICAVLCGVSIWKELRR